MTSGDPSQFTISSNRRRRTPKQRRSEATISSILQATTELAQTEGFAGLTTPQIAAKAGISIGSLYQYFSNREAVYATLYESASARCAVEVRTLMMKTINDSPDTGIPVMVNGVLKVYERNALILLKLIADVPAIRGSTSMPSSFEALVSASMKLYMQLHLPKGSEREIETRLFLMESGIIHAIQRYALERPPLILREKLVKDLSSTVLSYLNEERRDRLARPANSSRGNEPVSKRRPRKGTPPKDSSTARQ